MLLSSLLLLLHLSAITTSGMSWKMYSFWQGLGGTWCGYEVHGMIFLMT
jgi:hypothetical protein